MRVLLINQPWICNAREYGLRSGVRWAMIRQRDRSMPYYSFPFPLAYATSYLQKHGISATLRDSIALEESRETALAYIRQEQFDVVVLETATASIYNDMAFCDALKSQMREAVVCLTGQHSTALPREVLQQCKADYVFIGEYEKTLLDVVQALESRQPVDRMPGLACRNGDAIIDNGRAPLLVFDELPAPFRDKSLVGKYNEPASRHFPNLPMMTSRGCSFKCTFCVEAVANYGPKSSFRYRSLPNVVAEIRAMIEGLGVREIFFDDAFFTAQRAADIAQAILDSGLRIPWSCWVDRSTSEATLRLMKRSGCSGVKFGVETFNESIGLAAKKKVVAKTVVELVQRARRAGLLTHATYVFGLPGETPESIEHTIQAAMNLKTSSNQFSIATPLPGTEFFDEAKKKDWLVTYQWDRYEGQNSAVLKYEHLSSIDLEKAMVRVRKMKIRQLLLNPYLLSIFVIKLVRMMGVRKFMADMVRKAAFMARA